MQLALTWIPVRSKTGCPTRRFAEFLGGTDNPLHAHSGSRT